MEAFQDFIRYDFVGRMENFQDGCNYVFSKIRDDYADYYRPELRHATNSCDALNQYYDSDLREKIFSKYKVDFEYFGYDVNIP